MRLYWRQDAKGAPVTERSAEQCTGISPKPEDGQSWNDTCGLSIVAEIEIARDNDARAGALHVRMVDQHRLYAYQEAMQAEIDAGDTARRDKEVEQAEKKGADIGL